MRHNIYKKIITLPVVVSSCGKTDYARSVSGDLEFVSSSSGVHNIQSSMSGITYKEYSVSGRYNRA